MYFLAEFYPEHTFGSHCTEYVNTVLPTEQSCHCYEVFHACSPHCDHCFVLVREYTSL